MRKEVFIVFLCRICGVSGHLGLHKRGERTPLRHRLIRNLNKLKRRAQCCFTTVFLSLFPPRA